MLSYELEQYALSPDSLKYRARVVKSRRYSFADIAERLLKHNTGLSAAVIHGVWEGVKGAVEELVSEGGSINTEIFCVCPSIQGVFDGPEDTFDRKRHTVQLKMRPGSLLRGAPGKIKLRKRASAAKSFIVSVTDIKSGAVNDSLTPGMNIRVDGRGLKIGGDAASCGLYFVPLRSAAFPVKVEVPELVVNKPSQIIAIVPALGAGKWTLRLVTQCTTGPKYRKVPKSVSFAETLTVA